MTFWISSTMQSRVYHDDLEHAQHMIDYDNILEMNETAEELARFGYRLCHGCEQANHIGQMGLALQGALGVLFDEPTMDDVAEFLDELTRLGYEVKSIPRVRRVTPEGDQS